MCKLLVYMWSHFSVNYIMEINLMKELESQAEVKLLYDLDRVPFTFAVYVVKTGEWQFPDTMTYDGYFDEITNSAYPWDWENEKYYLLPGDWEDINWNSVLN